MLKNCRFMARLLFFCIILAFLLSLTNYILTPKKYFDNTWSTTSTFKGFYQMQENSIDVLFFGSSHAASAFNPQEIYNSYGIRSYNLGCEQQNLLVSYYWLKEALKYQTPKVVVLDSFMLFEYNRLEPLNTSEPCTRMAMDAMRWSDVKAEAIKAICDNDEQQVFNSYVFKNIRFHTRWTNLTEQDFSFCDMEEHYELKGFAPLNGRGIGVSSEFAPYEGFDEMELTEPVPLMKEYLDKIKELCDERNISLILAKTPTTEWSYKKHNYLTKYAFDNNVRLLDFNSRDVYDGCGFIYTDDLEDSEHSNIWGAKKISLYLASIFNGEYEIGKDNPDAQWEDTNGYYQRIVSDCTLPYITDLNEYIDAIDQDRYTILISTSYDMTFCVTDEVKNSFAKLGLDLSSEKYDSYFAAISDNSIVQQVGNDKLCYSGSTRGMLQNFSIVSGGADAGAVSSIIIGTQEYSNDSKGINIVVYNEETRKVIDSAVYDGTLHR